MPAAKYQRRAFCGQVAFQTFGKDFAPRQDYSPVSRAIWSDASPNQSNEICQTSPGAPICLKLDE
jgi:hypothetical protein